MKNRTNLIFLHKLIKAFADSLLKVFIPLIILKNSGSLMLTILYINVYYILCAGLNYILKSFLQKYGVIAIILHTLPIVALQFVLTASINWWIVLILALLASLAQALYSVPLNILFAFTDKEVNVAKFQIATNIGKLVFTLLSGYVIGSGHKNSLLILSIVGTILYILSAIPIWFGYNLLKDAYEKAAQNTNVASNKDYRWFNVFHICFSMFQSVLDILLPIYLYVNNLTFEAVAIVVALIEALKMLANIFAKYLVSKGKAFVSTMLSVGCFLVGVIVMLIVKVPVVLYICSSFVAVSFPLIFVPMFSTFCKKVQRDGLEFDGMSYRDVYIFVGKLPMYIPYFILPSLLTSFIVGIGAGVGVGITSYKILKDKKSTN